LPSRLVHYDPHEANLMVTKKVRPVLIDFDFARLSDPAHDVRGVILEADTSERGAKEFKEIYQQRLTKADPEMAECLEERIALCSRIKLRRVLVNLPRRIARDVLGDTGGDAEKAKRRSSERAENLLRWSQPHLGIEAIPGDEFVAAVMDCPARPAE
jgi:thiamine kinase-like enzyme